MSKVQHNTFYLLWCEGCQRTEEPLRRRRIELAQPLTEPMRCVECGDLLTLIECFISGTQTWQARPGSAWRHVVSLDALPHTSGRQIWTEAP